MRVKMKKWGVVWNMDGGGNGRGVEWLWNGGGSSACVFSISFTSSSYKPCSSRCAMVSSSPSRSRALIAVPRTSIVTEQPSLRNILAYSIAMIPDPTIA